MSEQTMRQDKYMYVDVRKCARCQENHDHVLFQILNNAADEWCWYGTCPMTNQPILMKVTDQK